MKFNNILIVLLLATFSCSPNYTKLDNRVPYNAKGFALIYNKSDFENKSLKNSINGSQIKVFHKSLKSNTLIKLINPKNNLYLIVKNDKKFDYPDFYKIIITDAVAKKLEIDLSLPLIEIIEIKKNKSFVAKKAKISNEEKKVPSKAPVASVQISNISKIKKKQKNLTNNFDQIYLHVGTFYSTNTAIFLKKRITEELKNLDGKKLKIKKINNKETQVISGPYTSINLLKNDYTKLRNFGFEELDILINE